MELNEYIKEAGAIAEEKGFHDSEKIIDKLAKFASIKLFQPNELLAVIRAFETQKLALIITELCEAIEAHRRGNDYHLKEEIADTLIRIFDFVAVHIPDIEVIIKEKMEFNKTRPKKHGKLY